MYRFLRNYGQYKKGKDYKTVDIEKKEIEALKKNGTLKEIEVKEDEETAVKELNITQTYLKENHKEIYDTLIEKGKKSRDKEVEKLEAELTELKASLDVFEGA